MTFMTQVILPTNRNLKRCEKCWKKAKRNGFCDRHHPNQKMGSQVYIKPIPEEPL
jgi:hypothetical protein